MTQLPRQLADGSPEGNVFGISPFDNVSFFGAAPTTQPTSPAQTQITDSSGGVANSATGVAAVPATYNQAQIANAFATIVAGHNAIVAALMSLGLIKGS